MPQIKIVTETGQLVSDGTEVQVGDILRAGNRHDAVVAIHPNTEEPIARIREPTLSDVWFPLKDYIANGKFSIAGNINVFSGRVS